MSKAFTREQDGEQEGDEPAEEEAAPRGSNYITREGYLALERELARLWHDERPKITSEVQAAAAQGDRSENAEYIYGKKKLREIDRRVRFLRKRLDILKVVDAAPEHRGRVYFGAWVSIEDDDGVAATYRIVGRDEIDLAKRLISVDAPVAKALLGKSLGDVVTVQRPKGPMEVTITKIHYEHA